MRVLEAAINEVVRRHEILRSSIHTTDGRPFLSIAPSLSVTLSANDLRELPVSERRAESLRIATREAQKPIPLDTPPLFRISLLRLGEAEFVILFIIHLSIRRFYLIFTCINYIRFFFF